MALLVLQAFHCICRSTALRKRAERRLSAEH